MNVLERALSVLDELPALKELGTKDRDFVQRVYSTPIERYFAKLKSIGLQGLESVADLGCGYGQWSLCLAELNQTVKSCEVSSERISLFSQLVTTLKLSNLDAASAPAEETGIQSSSIEGILCFGVLQYLDTTAFLTECFRILKKGGRLYINGKDIGGYLYFWLEAPRLGNDYDPRAMAADAFANTWHLEKYGTVAPWTKHRDRIVPKDDYIELANKMGFEVMFHGPEGSNSVDPDRFPPENFFAAEYCGLPKAYEVLLQKEG